MAIYDSEAVQFIKDTFGYDSEIMNLNAHAAIKMFKMIYYQKMIIMF